MKKLLTLGASLALLYSCVTPGPGPDKNAVVDAPRNWDLAAEVRAFKQPSDAKTLLDKIEAQGIPKNLSPDNRVIYAGLLMADSRFTDAQTQYQETLTADKDNKAALTGLALLAGSQGRKTDQKKYLTQYLQAYPQDPEVHALMGQAYLDDGQDDKAQKSFNLALAQGDHPAALMGLGVIALNKKKYEEAQKFLDRALALDGNNDLLYSLRAQNYRAQGRFGTAEKELDLAIEKNPQSTFHYLDRGIARLQQRQHAKALEDFNQAITLDSENFLAYVRRAETHQTLEQYPEALRDFRQVLKMKPEYRPAYPQAAVAAFLGGDLDLCIQMAGESAKQYKTEMAFPLLQALALKKQGRSPEAKAVLEGAYGQLPPQPLIQELFRFMMNPTADFTLNNLMNAEKDQVLKLRVEYYLALHNWATGLVVPATNQLENITKTKLKNIPEISWAKAFLQVLKP